MTAPTAPTGPAVGDTSPVLERTVELADMVAYGGATWDWHRIHYDPDFIAAKQLPAALVDGQVYGAWYVALLQDWLGPRCFVRSLEFSFRNPMFAGETMRCEGTVVDVADGPEGPEVTVEISSVVLAGDGPDARGERIAAAPVRAVVWLDRADGPAA